MSYKQESVAYQYSPLPSGTAFRCLILQPGLDDAPLVCSLHTGSLDSLAVEYEAISYVWGSTTKEETILCDGAFLKITTNLHEALTRFRLPDAPRTLWADSICINQDDLDEKSCQVSLMGTIYGLAKRVLVYLRGNEDGHAIMVRSLTQRVTNIIESHITTLRTPVPWNSFPRAGTADIELLYTDSRWPSMAVLTNHPWFSRAWVIQEVTLAKQVLPTWGKHELSWEHLMTTITWVTRRAGRQMGIRFAMSHMLCFSHRHEAIRRAFFPETTFFVSPFLHFLDLSRVLGVSNPRDKIYAFREIPYFDSKSRKAVQPDYKVDMMEAFRQFAEGHVRECQSPEILDYVTHSQDSFSRGTLSWVPQWQSSREVGKPLVAGITGGNWTRMLSRTMSVGRSTVNGAVTLSVEATVIDEVTYASSILDAGSKDPWREAITEVITHAWHALLARNLPSPYHSNHLLDALLNAVTVGLYVGTPEDWFGSMAAVSHKILESSQSSTKAASPWIAIFPHRDPLPFLALTWTRLQNHRIVLTSRGYIGLAPSQAQKGDFCGIIFGCKTPCILRKRSPMGGYAFIGPTYIPGRSTTIGPYGSVSFRILGSEGSKEWTEWDDVEEGYIDLH